MAPDAPSAPRVAVLTAAGSGMGAAAARTLAAAGWQVAILSSSGKGEALANELGGLGMNNVLPGYIDSLPEKEDRRTRIPMGRYGSAAEVAELVAFLASDKASYITGQNIRIDGGITRSV